MQNFLRSILSFFQPKPAPKPAPLPPAPKPAPPAIAKLQLTLNTTKTAGTSAKIASKPSVQGQSSTNLSNLNVGSTPVNLEQALRSGGLNLDSGGGGSRSGGSTAGSIAGGQVSANEPPQLSPEETANNAIAQAFQDIQAQYLGNVNPNTPFSFDEALAKNAAIQQYAPIYAQTLAQFLQGVRVRGQRSQQDAAQLLQELGQGTDYFAGRSKQLLDLAQEQSRQGFAERGLLYSGEQGRSQGLLASQRQGELQNFLQGQQRKQEGTQQQGQRILEDLLAEKATKERQLATSQQYEVSSAVEEARRREQARAAGVQLEALGPAPGQTYSDFLTQRGNTLQQFLTA